MDRVATDDVIADLLEELLNCANADEIHGLLVDEASTIEGYIKHLRT